MHLLEINNNMYYDLIMPLKDYFFYFIIFLFIGYLIPRNVYAGNDLGVTHLGLLYLLFFVFYLTLFPILLILPNLIFDFMRINRNLVKNFGSIILHLLIAFLILIPWMASLDNIISSYAFGGAIIGRKLVVQPILFHPIEYKPILFIFIHTIPIILLNFIQLKLRIEKSSEDKFKKNPKAILKFMDIYHIILFLVVLTIAILIKRSCEC